MGTGERGQRPAASHGLSHVGATRCTCACVSRSLSVSSVSSVSSATSSSSSVHTVDSDDMYADLASPVSSASSRSPTPAQPKKEKGTGAPVSWALWPQSRLCVQPGRRPQAGGQACTECPWSLSLHAAWPVTCSFSRRPRELAVLGGGCD